MENYETFCDKHSQKASLKAKYKATKTWITALLKPHFWLFAGVKFALALAETQALQRFGARFHARVMPGCEDTVWWTDEYWECMCRVITTTIYHYSGTAKMGPANDPGKE